MLAYAALGALHGINPAMGWLFAVALALRARRRAKIALAIPPIVLGHLASVAVIVAAIGMARLFIDPTLVRIAGALALVLFGGYKLLAARMHPRWVGMRVGFGDLTLWSFVMSSAHGAGLMLIPVLLHRAPAPSGDMAAHSLAGASGPMQGIMLGGLAAVAVHTAVFATMTAAVAMLVYEVFGLGFLRRAWVNLDALWAGALVAAGLVTLVA